MDTPEKLPMRKAMRFIWVSGTKVRMASVKALRKLDTATPESTMVIREAPVFRAIP